MQPPPLLYKYETLSTLTLQNLKAQCLYFGSPTNFNDPYDCALTPNIEIPTDEEVEQIRKYNLKNGRRSTNQRLQLETLATEDLRQFFVGAATKTLQAASQSFLINRGVTCFSEVNDDLLMWSHYGGKYKGICLEFTTETEAFEKVRQVHYVDHLPTVRVSDILIEPTFDLMITKLFATKSKS
jgi:hypothetical protein